MVPSDDAAAQRELTATLERFRGDARVALGLRPGDDAAAARKAFMALCKVYHPAKFARFSPPIVKLANEVFLSIRRAYESLSSAPAPGRAATSPGVGVASERPSGNLPRIVKFTPPTGVPIQAPPAVPPAPTPHPPTPVRTPPPAPRPPERPSGSIPRATTPRPTTPSPAPTHTPAPTITRPPAPPSGLDRALDPALELAQKEKWAEARAAFVDVATRHPGDPRYRAFVHYARGWEAFSLGKEAEARAEWQRANACDPTNALVKWAMESTRVVK